MSLSIKIKDYELVGEHIEFIIEITDKSTGDSWKFQRRYSNLRDAHKQLKSFDSRVPEFPPKKIFGSKNPRFLQQRKSDLESYLNDVAKLSKLLENSFAKEFFRPRDSVTIKSSPSEPTTVYKKPKQGPQMQNFVNQLNEAISVKFFDLSAQPGPPEDEDIKRQMKVFESLTKNVKVSDNNRVPEGSHINEAYHKTTVVRQGWSKTAFEDLLKITRESDTPNLLITFK